MDDADARRLRLLLGDASSSVIRSYHPRESGVADGRVYAQDTCLAHPVKPFLPPPPLPSSSSSRAAPANTLTHANVLSRHPELHADCTHHPVYHYETDASNPYVSKLYPLTDTRDFVFDDTHSSNQPSQQLKSTSSKAAAARRASSNLCDNLLCIVYIVFAVLMYYLIWFGRPTSFSRDAIFIHPTGPLSPADKQAIILEVTAYIEHQKQFVKRYPDSEMFRRSLVVEFNEESARVVKELKQSLEASLSEFDSKIKRAGAEAKTTAEEVALDVVNRSPVPSHPASMDLLKQEMEKSKKELNGEFASAIAQAQTRLKGAVERAQLNARSSTDFQTASDNLLKRYHTDAQSLLDSAIKEYDPQHAPSNEFTRINQLLNSRLPALEQDLKNLSDKAATLSAAAHNFTTSTSTNTTTTTTASFTTPVVDESKLKNLVDHQLQLVFKQLEELRKRQEPIIADPKVSAATVVDDLNKLIKDLDKLNKQYDELAPMLHEQKKRLDDRDSSAAAAMRTELLSTITNTIDALQSRINKGIDSLNSSLLSQQTQVGADVTQVGTQLTTLKHLIELRQGQFNDTIKEYRALMEAAKQKEREARAQCTSGGGGGGGGQAECVVKGSGLNQGEVEDMIYAALTKYSSGRVGLMDWTIGGHIFHHSPTLSHLPSHHAGNSPSILSKVSDSVTSFFDLPAPSSVSSSVTAPPNSHDATNVLDDRTELGRCWAMKGSDGFVVIHLKEAVVITSVTIEHVSPKIARTNATAPKLMKVWGVWPSGQPTSAAVEAKRHSNLQPVGDELGDFIYDLNAKTPWQTFAMEQNNNVAYNMATIGILSNYDDPNYTCIYRIRVHGYRPSQKP